MKGIAFLPGFITGLLISGLALPAFSQVTSDNTTNTTVNLNGNNFDILNGIQKGNNLFHSFKEFSIPTNGSATFNNSSDVVNIINRVTGGNISNIDGLIKSQGNANLFLINPAGIVFGENAKLDIGGSFLGTTAESVLFKDGFEFSAVNSQNEPLLTISVPVGLQMGTNTGEIQVNGSGHNLVTQDINVGPYINLASSSLLEVKPGKVLALIGGDIMLDGAVMNVKTGRVELSSVREGKVNFNQNNQDFKLNIPQDSKLGNIQLTQKSLIDAGAGSIKVNSGSVSLKNGSVLLVQNQELQPTGDININATESLEVNGMSPDGRIRSAISNQTLGGMSGNINVVTPRLIVQSGGAIGSQTFTPAPGGHIFLDVEQLIEVSGFSEINPLAYSSIASITIGDGKAGNVIASTKHFSIFDNGLVSGVTVGNGDGGTINIDTQTLEVKGIGLGLLTSSGITTSTLGKGNAGNININTETMTVEAGAYVANASHNVGNAGNLTINATKSLQVVGNVNELPARLNSFVRPLPNLQELFNLPDVPSGNAGNITINTPFLLVADRGLVTVGNSGSGNAGILNINADLIKLDDLGQLSATTVFGEGGDISLQSQSLQMRGESIITTSAGGKGNGGNIDINTNTLVALENSDITANAQNSFGGKVTINAEGIFGTQFREQQTIKSDITATSELGAEFNGVVELNTPGVDPNSGISELPENLTDSSQEIASGCSSNTGSSFVATGRGGIAKNPNEQVDINPIWSDIRDLSAFHKRKNNIQATQISNKPAIVEATIFIRNSKGEIELVAAQNTPFNRTQVANCSGANT
ncbi:hypothetical protein NIES267_30310 [Calothrix parasitica NIES-267]|uniref:Filamentous haemagglutinin FhaB/tRNA nuclease CdiA-like TPS domain-containing protein n=1 Tax=Calothrix parasitica NIES-267 TaxID=1973488 RepID=A0A1Z4LQK9_9CYAN|nr:hypothetical protein NIES267_30310 [Calothrix parasitica NIES-267]